MLDFNAPVNFSELKKDKKFENLKNMNKTPVSNKYLKRNDVSAKVGKLYSNYASGGSHKSKKTPSLKKSQLLENFKSFSKSKNKFSSSDKSSKLGLNKNRKIGILRGKTSQEFLKKLADAANQQASTGSKK